MRIAEKTLLMFALISYVVMLISDTGKGAIMLSLSALMLCVLYLCFGFALFNGIRFRDIIKKSAYAGIPRLHIAGAVFVSVFMCVACIGILFKLQWWVGGVFLLIISILLGSFIFTFTYQKIKGKHRLFYKQVLGRVIPVGLFCMLLSVIPRKFFLELTYHNHPTYIMAVERSWKDPENPQLADSVQKEWLKFNAY